ncbi:MAG: hypothetical protein R6U67_05555 [Sodalinema sp.]
MTVELPQHSHILLTLPASSLKMAPKNAPNGILGALMQPVMI